MFENTALKIPEDQSDKVEEAWGKLHTEEVHHLYSSPNIIRVIKS
jgi:hypothetical protein